MRKLFLITIVLCLIAGPVLAAMDYAACDQARRSGWNHPGLVNACIMHIMGDVFGGGWEGDFPGDADDIGGNSVNSENINIPPGDADDIAGRTGDYDDIGGRR